MKIKETETIIEIKTERMSVSLDGSCIIDTVTITTGNHGRNFVVDYEKVKNVKVGDTVLITYEFLTN